MAAGRRQQVAHCMQEHVRVSSTERIVVSSPCSVTLRSSTSTCRNNQQHGPHSIATAKAAGK